MERRCVLNSWSNEEVRVVIRYEWASGVTGTEIHNHLVEVYGPGVMSKQMVQRWCRTFSDGRQQVEDIPRAGRTRTATTDANVGKVDDMIRANRRITIDEVAEELGISHERGQNIIHDILRYRKVARSWNIVKPHIPLIKFRKGGKDVPGSQTLGVSPSRSQKGLGIDESELPAKYSRKPVSQIEIEFIERGGPE
ncbi:histone-lysine N-methyltransferase SETMAR [Trichonephila inaurata madagascariensis]|uniref:Histone-lysine N-methyltransferase SETMAR n=1 Tax=Trichonephila inaurata madagascariensis TaxID=2747483 RepID=A0A8X6WMS9_9ARAC|nr:histone-lysine N-methyltransferase SETMAR [Trichonephila inaurata madagascariensis]GFY52858.1 histone-lysine N-methyltransferase SETMAR [Trichonephila inaurata madagascariensis]